MCDVLLNSMHSSKKKRKKRQIVFRGVINVWCSVKFNAFV